MIPITDLDYIKYYVERLKKDPEVFKQQKTLIESQLHSSKEIFKKKFGNENFKKNAREYLRNIGLLKNLK
ncbi:hypothetical protein CMI42_02445 [Candidatus Pacearchaeota archaeon]|nr:hypothetical protein [Candidatus Pacearchaeota archaeon]|tara:strand:+ start:1268 stop:1477 length:210 start_codon:yes stop_codon:yes gene_type:complete